MIRGAPKDSRTAETGPRNFVNLLTRRIHLEGLIILDYLSKMQLAQMRMIWWMKRGQIKDRHTLVRGLDNAPQALTQIFRGDNIGKLIVEIGEPTAADLVQQ